MSKQLSTLGVGTTFEVPVKSAYQSLLGQYVVLKMADKNHSGYPSNSVTLIFDKIPIVLAFDAKEPNNSNSDRKNYGNNRYSVMPRRGIGTARSIVRINHRIQLRLLPITRMRI